jgi:hypothetical protein
LSRPRQVEARLKKEFDLTRKGVGGEGGVAAGEEGAEAGGAGDLQQADGFGVLLSLGQISSAALFCPHDHHANLVFGCVLRLRDGARTGIGQASDAAAPKGGIDFEPGTRFPPIGGAVTDGEAAAEDDAPSATAADSLEPAPTRPKGFDLYKSLEVTRGAHTRRGVCMVEV